MRFGAASSDSVTTRVLDMCTVFRLYSASPDIEGARKVDIVPLITFLYAEGKPWVKPKPTRTMIRRGVVTCQKEF